jgi:deoxyribonuclease-2
MSYRLQLTIPSIYESVITNTVATQAPNISALVKGKTSSAAICANHTLTTLAGKAFSFYTKSATWNKDLWYSCIAPSLKKDLFVESWIRGSAIGPSCSGSYQVNDVQAVDFPEDATFSWSEYNDHSKWAVSTDGEVMCMGDINRMTTQYVRGGGAICFSGAKYNLMKAVSKENAC